MALPRLPTVQDSKLIMMNKSALFKATVLTTRSGAAR